MPIGTIQPLYPSSDLPVLSKLRGGGILDALLQRTQLANPSIDPTANRLVPVPQAIRAGPAQESQTGEVGPNVAGLIGSAPNLGAAVTVPSPVSRGIVPAAGTAATGGPLIGGGTSGPGSPAPGGVGNQSILQNLYAQAASTPFAQAGGGDTGLQPRGGDVTVGGPAAQEPQTDESAGTT